VTTEIEIANIACVKLGISPVTSTDDTIANIQGTDKDSRLIKTQYAPCRDAVLESRPWSFAMVRRELARDTSSPDLPAYNNQEGYFLVPTDILRVHRVFDNVRMENLYERWSKEEKWIFAPEVETIWVLGIKQQTDTTLFSANMIQALACHLAATICVDSTENTDLEKKLWAEYEEKLSEAAALDGAQGITEVFEANSLVGARVGYGVRW